MPSPMTELKPWRQPLRIAAAPLDTPKTPLSKVMPPPPSPLARHGDMERAKTAMHNATRSSTATPATPKFTFDPSKVDQAEYLKWRATVVLHAGLTPLNPHPQSASDERTDVLTTIIARLKQHYAQARPQIEASVSSNGAWPFSRHHARDDTPPPAEGTPSKIKSGGNKPAQPPGSPAQTPAERQRLEDLLYASLNAPTVAGVDYMWRPREGKVEQDEDAAQRDRELDEQMKMRLLKDLDEDTHESIVQFEAALKRARDVEGEERRWKQREKEGTERERYTSTWGRR
ncbi:hypothetical protein FH972_022662 [Carpinus fangiana]|uniref:Uncharacterized protein n=1 Tax=Carpinus fangiana TaxID=176857 RepID=A0A5N6KSV4_9ROSI|nr:hypothetical protein FH972_022662 [Carpinus fangiana]